jgi:hypothetical protein
MIDYIAFKKYLNNNNIFLFDSHYRIAHFRYNNLNKLIKNQSGGSINNNIMNKLNMNILKHFINSLLDKKIPNYPIYYEKNLKIHVEIFYRQK